MRLPACRPLYLTLLLLGGTAPALQAQSSPVPASGAGIYSCVDDQGRRITADRPIPGCTAKEQRVLNKDGSLKAVYPPILTVEERAQKEAAERKAAEARAAQADAVRRDRYLRVRYTNEAPHRTAREAALDTVRLAIQSSEKRLKETRPPSASRCWTKPSSMSASRCRPSCAHSSTPTMPPPRRSAKRPSARRPRWSASRASTMPSWRG